MESLIAWGPKEKDVLMLTEYVRGDLARFLAHRAALGARILPCYCEQAGDACKWRICIHTIKQCDIRMYHVLFEAKHGERTAPELL